ncbi:MAG TPA: nuclear transport factor 2 family protein [Longimicrobiaceae bacterium]|nr:nuclear transport factor 2 family protein [Longimicrobiaceae bacterium]
MHRILGTALSATLLLTACKIEPTPRQFYSQRNPAATERQISIEELRDRVAAIGPALDRRDPRGAVFALAPAPDAYVIGPGGGSPAVGPEGMAAALQAMMDTVPADFVVGDVRVTLEPRARTGWFTTAIRVQRRDSASWDTLHLSGVYQRIRGEWLLVQAHLSRPFMAPGSQQSPAQDSSRRGGGAVPEAPAI